MLNEEKIRLMTKAAAFESGEGKKALEMNRFYKGDYISLHLIGAWFSYTVAFCLCVGLWAFYKMEYLMSNINRLDLPAMGRGLALLYLSLLGVYLVTGGKKKYTLPEQDYVEYGGDGHDGE